MMAGLDHSPIDLNLEDSELDPTSDWLQLVEAPLFFLEDQAAEHIIDFASQSFYYLVSDFSIYYLVNFYKQMLPDLRLDSGLIIYIWDT